MPFIEGESLRDRYAVALSRTTEWRAEGIRRLRSYLRLRSFGVAVLSYMALAGSLEADGDRAGAAEAYAHVVRLWKNADPHLQPVVRQARDALARLTGER
jgi:cytochrome c-type biogenesis protein CcmH/NrfG